MFYSEEWAKINRKQFLASKRQHALSHLSHLGNKQAIILLDAISSPNRRADFFNYCMKAFGDKINKQVAQMRKEWVRHILTSACDMHNIEVSS